MASADKLLQRISLKRLTPQRDDVTSFKSTAPRKGTQSGSTGGLRLRGAGGAMTLGQRWHLVHRLITAAAAILYCIAALYGSVGAFRLMRVHPNPSVDFAPYTTALLGSLVGTTTIAGSPLMQLLNNQVTPRSDTLFVDLGPESDSATPVVSFTGCASANEVDNIYANVFLRSVYDALVHDASYNLTFFGSAQSELIVPVVDCTSSARAYSDSSVLKVFYLLRNKQPQPELLGTDRVKLLTVTLSNQGYKVPSRDEKGSVGAATLTFFHSLDKQHQGTVTHYFALAIGYPFENLNFQVYEYVNTTDDAFWTLRSVPRDSATQVSRTLMTASRTGFYANKETEQANIKNEYWTLSDDPIDVVTTMQWTGRTVLSDAWAWPHLVHFFLGLDVIVQMLILLLVVYRNGQKGKLWIGDAFMCISKTLQLRGLLVLGSWYLNGCWALVEYFYFVGNEISQVEQVVIHREIVQADLMTLYLAAVDLVAKVAQERLDPALSLFLFFVAFQSSAAIIRGFPVFVKVLSDKTLRDYQMGVVQTVEDLSKITPMRLWNVHPIGATDVAFALAAVSPLLLSLGVIITLVIMTKLRRRWLLVRQQQQRGSAVGPLKSSSSEIVQSESGSTANLFASIPTMPAAPSVALAAKATRFEMATGVELAHHFGLRCDYDNLRTIKGLKYVSADGIYSNGFVIANGAFLVATEDVVAIVLTKLLRFRYRNIYVYDVEGGHSVQQMARLVYPDTLALHDLLHLNITTLA